MIDSYYYGKFIFVPAQIVLYNVFKQGGGPELYGTEPWSFYLRNGVLNFNIMLPLALCCLPLMVAFIATSRQTLH